MSKITQPRMITTTAKRILTTLFLLVSCSAIGQTVYKCDVFIKGDSISVKKKPNHTLYRGFWGDDWILDNYNLGYNYFMDYNVYIWNNGNGKQPYDYYQYFNGGESYKARPNFKEVVISAVRYRQNLISRF